MWTFRRPVRDETDWELLVLLVSLAGALVASVWFAMHLPLPSCTLREFTGIPCPTCGATRAVRAFLGGDWAAALGYNPLLALLLVVLVLFNLYAALVLILHLPRLRWHPPADKPASNLWKRMVMIAIILVNWAFVIWKHPH